jgi:hypothetical protein
MPRKNENNMDLEAHGEAPLRKALMPMAQFRQAAEVARLAVELSKANGGETHSKLAKAWELIQQAREIVAPTLTEREMRAKRVEDTFNEAARVGGTRDAIVKHIDARLAAARIDSGDLIGEPGESGQPEIDIWNSNWLDGETGWHAQKPVNTNWKRMTREAFKDLLGGFARAKYPDSREEATRCVNGVLEELKNKGSLSDSVVWEVLVFRHAALSERNKKAAETRAANKTRAKHDG